MITPAWRCDSCGSLHHGDRHMKPMALPGHVRVKGLPLGLPEDDQRRTLVDLCARCGHEVAVALGKAMEAVREKADDAEARAQS